jgi:hypothetical protein
MPPVAREASRVLVVVDMQQDYDLAANLELYGRVRSPYANDIAPLVPMINRVRNSAAWERVVWTLDWLPAAMERTFCRAGTPGAALLPALDFREAEDVLFKKDSDDSFCEVGGLPEERTSCATLGRQPRPGAQQPHVCRAALRALHAQVCHARTASGACAPSPPPPIPSSGRKPTSPDF